MGKRHLHILIAYAFFFPVYVHAEGANASHRDNTCWEIIPDGYDKYKAPSKNGKPTEVFIQMEILDMDEINEATMDFRLHAFVRSYWCDYRIQENKGTKNLTDLHEGCLQYIWTPDLIFEQAKEMIDTGKNNQYFRFHNGYFYLSERHSFKVSCMMNFRKYPFDTQHCIFTIAFMYTEDNDAILKWFANAENPNRRNVPSIRFQEEQELLQFIMVSLTTHSKVNEYMFANFTYLLANFTLSRRLTTTIINHYMPSALLVVVSWISFWLRVDAAAERVTLCMTALLTLCTQEDQYKQQLPPVNYITAMDIWFFVCIFMIFASLFEFAFSYNIYMKAKERKTDDSIGEQKPKKEGFVKLSGDMEADNTNERKYVWMSILSSSRDVTKIDSLCKVAFPGSFVIFMSAYWIYFISTADKL